MNFIDRFMEKWDNFCRNTKPARTNFRKKWKVFADKVVYIWNYIKKFKKLFLTVPVAVMALMIAILNWIKLPSTVGLGLQANGEFSVEIPRFLAVHGSLAVTAICLLLVFASKRTLTPWMVSVVSLLLPLLILLTNTFAI